MANAAVSGRPFNDSFVVVTVLTGLARSGRVLLLMIQLQDVRRMLVVLATGPLALIGVALIMAAFQIPFGFVAMLGGLSLFGMVLRNSVILIAQIDVLSAHAGSLREAVREAAVHRFRPIILTALAAILAMIALASLKLR